VSHELSEDKDELDEFRTGREEAIEALKEANGALQRLKWATRDVGRLGRQDDRSSRQSEEAFPHAHGGELEMVSTRLLSLEERGFSFRGGVAGAEARGGRKFSNEDRHV
jgi:hypothetical protein